MTMLQGRQLETADTTIHLRPYELFRGNDGLSEYIDSSGASDETATSIHKTLVDAPDWLPFAAEQYETSSELADYFVVPTIIMPTDLPNRNLVSFPLQELTKFNSTIGDLTYRGWKGKPIYVEHANLDFTKSMGAVVDVAMRPIKRTNPKLHKVVALMAIDRTKYRDISSAILRGSRPNFSMGALIKKYTCSVCGASTEMKAGMNSKYERLACRTSHAGPDRNGGFRTFPLPSGGVTLGYLKVEDILPFEVSSVGVPAYASADSNPAEIRDL